MSNNPILWQASSEQLQATAMYQFMRKHGFDNYDDLFQWSIDESAAFWESLCEFCDVHFDAPATTTLSRPGDIMDAGWFAGSKLNYAAHLLRHEGDRAAIVFRCENGDRRELSFDQLRQAVADIAAGLQESGVVKGDRVAGFLPNCPEAVVAMLAAASLGATWSSCSPDFGVNGVVDRFGQIEPKVLFAANGYFYNGKRIDSLPVVAGIVDRVPSIKATVISPFLSDSEDLSSVNNAVAWRDFAVADSVLSFVPVEFNHPLYVMYSSGTSGVPKCIVHGHGGSLLQHLKEHVLHTNISEQDRLFYFTTCGWMMWNWLVSGLATGATLILFDASGPGTISICPSCAQCFQRGRRWRQRASITSTMRLARICSSHRSLVERTSSVALQSATLSCQCGAASCSAEVLAWRLRFLTTPVIRCWSKMANSSAQSRFRRHR